MGPSGIVPGKNELTSPQIERVKVRNSIAHDFIASEGISENDLFALILPHPEWHDASGVHFTQTGKDAEGKQVVEEN